MQKTINFTSEKLEKNFQDFLQKRPDINELETDFERKIAFAGSLLFDDNGCLLYTSDAADDYLTV